MKVFICYSRTNINDAKALAEAISRYNELNATVFFDIDSIRFGELFRPKIWLGLKECDAFLVIYTHKTYFSFECWREIVTAVFFDCLFRKTKRKFILPIVFSKRFIRFTPLSRYQFLVPSDNWVNDICNNLKKLGNNSTQSEEQYAQYNIFQVFASLLFWPFALLCTTVALMTLYVFTLFSFISVIVLAIWSTVLFTQGRQPYVSDRDYFAYRVAYSPSPNARAIFFESSKDQNCNITRPIPQITNFCSSLESAYKVPTTHEVFINATYSTQILGPFGYTLCSFPNTTFAPWISIKFSGKKRGADYSLTFRLMEGILTHQNGGVVNYHGNLEALMQAFDLFKERQTLKTKSELPIFRDNKDWITGTDINNSANRVELITGPGWCMPLGYEIFHSAISKLITPPKY
ncbi:toll/interleukin-1 receptor domain-containing protein [Azospirillum palustre]